MVGRARSSFIRYLFVLTVLGLSGCAGTPSDFNTVVLRPSAREVAAGGTVTITASVPKDTMNEGVTWIFTPEAGVANPGTFLSNNTQATFTAPVTVTASYYVTITATSIAFPTETNSVKITVQPPQPLKITTTSLPNGTLNVLYQTTTLQATGGVQPYTWSILSGTLPAGLMLAPNGTISGTPTGTTTGTSTIKFQVADAETPPMMQNTSLSITITNLLTGNYAFEFNGFNSHGAVVAAGTFTSDGVSKISGGVGDFNTVAGPPTTNNTLETFTGTYTLGSDNRGTLTLTTSASGTLIYAFALDSQGLHGRLVELDSSGNRGSGEITQQSASATTCASSTLSGAGPLGADFVIGVTGTETGFGGAASGPFAVAGRFTAEVPANSSTPGTIDNGEVDANAPSSVQPIAPDTTFSGTFQTSSQASRCTMSVSQQIGNMDFAVYPITVSNGLVTLAYIVETDTVSVGTPFLSAGKLVHQTGYPFVNANQSFTTNATAVGGLAGPIIPSGQAAYVPFAAIAEVQTTGGGGFNLALVENINGTVASALGTNVIGATFGTGDSYGRVDTNLLTPIDPVFYVINSNEALCILENVDAPVLGILEPQSAGPFTTGTIAGSLIQGTSTPSTTVVQNYSGVVSLTSTGATTGTLTGTEDLSTTSANSPGLNVSGSYALTSTGQTDGSGSLNLTQTPPPPMFNGAFFIVSPTKAVMITTTAGDTNPVLTVLGDQSDDFGVN